MWLRAAAQFADRRGLPSQHRGHLVVSEGEDVAQQEAGAFQRAQGPEDDRQRHFDLVGLRDGLVGARAGEHRFGQVGTDVADALAIREDVQREVGRQAREVGPRALSTSLVTPRQRTYACWATSSAFAHEPVMS